ncbi:MAG: sigma-70 family RNA polymerase sigma factor [Candidatus Thorarchaeota archaeon]|jgi:RNA polymerase sigma factor (sigma-70 family)
MKLEVNEKTIGEAEAIAITICRQRGGVLDEDTLSAAREGLVVAIRTFNGSSPFGYWLRVKVNQKIVEEIRTRLKRKGTAPVLVPFEDNSFETSRDGLEDRLAFKDLLWKLQDWLTDKQKEVLRLRLDLCIKNKEIAGLLGVTTNCVNVRFSQIKRLVKDFKDAQG